MYARLSQVSRHLSRPSLSSSPAKRFVRTAVSPVMTSSIEKRRNRTINTAGCIIIGDEVLGGKTVDTNSAYFAKWCFSLGIGLKRVEVIADDEEEIIEAVRRMSSKYDFVVTSGGIGPTHDDITYESIAKAFSLPLKLNQIAFEKMKVLSKPHPSQPNFSFDTPSPALDAKLRMIRLPTDPDIPDERQILFPDDSAWVPVSIVNGNIHILPGVPRIFEALLDNLKPLIYNRLANPEGKGVYRLLFSTPMAESAVAFYLTDLAKRVEPQGIKVGSYPRWGKGRNTVTLVGKDKEFMESLVNEIEENVKGIRVESESDADESADEDDVEKKE